MIRLHLTRSPATLLALVLSCAGCAQKESPLAIKPLAVEASPVESVAFPEQINTISSLEAPDEVNLAAQAGGRIERLQMRQGDAVREGQLLVVLDQTQLREELRALVSQRNESKLNVERFEFLVRQGAAAPIQRDALRQNFIAADAAVRAKQSDLAFKDLRAPISGVVSDVKVNPGDVISAGTPFTTIQRTGRLLARVNVPAQYGQRVRLGQTVLVSDPTGGASVEGRLVSIDPRASGATQSFLAKAEIDNRDGRFRNGERVRTRLVIDRRPALSVPAVAVTRTSGQTFVFVVGTRQELEARPGNSPLQQLRALPATTRYAMKTPVSLRSLQNNRYPVRQGLQSGQLVIVSNLFSLRHGSPVSVR
ncbi:efflux RND transporter periplasmic adaptor subunit [Cyanobium sp. Copco_Reservoir_LC18]|uniref:efflux RND transporter periplasmic adaptor subunit n=1 Tax=Cyanobium sp. Copco_Reservoir_LC18 TaxID=1328305 RepID=UPI0013581CEA|nr:efflux RND transporter periplasmic adaptor subunit [Cyanobium sp. Copco_Reservoir_LC18]